MITGQVTASRISALYNQEVRPILVDPHVPVNIRRELVFRYVDLMTGIRSLSVSAGETRERHRNLRRLIGEINGEKEKGRYQGEES